MGIGSYHVLAVEKYAVHNGAEFVVGGAGGNVCECFGRCSELFGQGYVLGFPVFACFERVLGEVFFIW